MKENIFHQAVRYSYAKQTVNLLRTKKVHTILEVGAGAHARLAEYLPDDTLTFLDLNLPQEVLKDQRFVIGDATCLVYEKESFDFVIALDVMEHIPKERREKFISSIHRVAKQGVILSVPFDSSQNPHDDRLLKSFYTLAGTNSPIWIDEHVDCTLPSKEDILRYMGNQGICTEQAAFFYGERRRLMQKMLIMEAAASRYTCFQDFFSIVNAEYNESILEADFGLAQEDAAKLYVVWTKENPSAAASVQEYFDGCKANQNKAAEIFERKYTELMGWAIGFACITEAANLEEQYRKILADMVQEHGEFTSKMSEGMEICREILQKNVGILQQGDQILLKGTEILSKSNEIIGKLKEEEDLKLHVILVTYNHEEFIRDTLQSVLMQRTNFCFHILVADDCSTDNTVSIIREMEEQTDIPFEYLTNNHNLGIMQNYKRAFAACNAPYAAVIEGDDLWTDPYRLQKHVDFLDSHCECAMSFNQYLVKNDEEGTIALQPRFSDAQERMYYRYLTGHDLAYSNLIGNFSTCVYRSSALKALPDQMYSFECYDWLTNLMVSKMGYIGCLIQPMSIYRIHEKGVWSGQSEIEKTESVIKSIDIYDEFTNREFSEGFAAHKARLQASLVLAPVQKNSTVKTVIKRMLKQSYEWSKYLPPVFLYIVKLLIPDKMKEKVVRHL